METILPEHYIVSLRPVLPNVKILTHPVPTTPDFRKVWNKFKVKTIYNLLEQEDINLLKYHEINLKQIYKGFRVVSFSIMDGGLPDMVDTKEFIQKIVDSLLSSKENISVHCAGGVGRTGLVVALIVKNLLKISGQEAINYIRKVNPIYIDSFEQEDFVKSF